MNYLKRIYKIIFIIIFLFTFQSDIFAEQLKKYVEYKIKSGDTISSLIIKHNNEIKELIFKKYNLKSSSEQKVLNWLLNKNYQNLKHTIYVGNILRIFENGVLEVKTGKGKAPLVFSSPKQLEMLEKLSPELIEKQIENIELDIAVIDFTISDKGKTLKVSNKTYQAGEGITFSNRRKHFHIVGVYQKKFFSIPVWPNEGKESMIPKSPFYEVSPSGVLELPKDKSGLGALLAEGQLHIHDDHYHITHKFKSLSLAKFYKSKEDESTFSAIRKKVASAILLLLIQKKFYIEQDNFSRKLHEINDSINRAWRVFESGLNARLISFIVKNDLEISDMNKVLTVKDKRFYAGSGIKFEYCSKHLHIIGELVPNFIIALELDEDGAVIIKPNIFFKLENEKIVAKKPPELYTKMIENNELKFWHGDYRISKDFENEKLKQLLIFSINFKIPKEIKPKRDQLKKDLKEVFSTPIDFSDERTFYYSITEIDGIIEKLWEKNKMFINLRDDSQAESNKELLKE